MATRNAKLGTTDWGSENPASDDMNDTINAVARLVSEVYTGTGFDTTTSADTATDNDDHELTAITAAQLTGSDYIKISCLLYCSVGMNSGSGTVDYAQNRLQFQTKYTGGSYADTMAKITIQRIAHANTGSTNTTQLYNLIKITWLHTLTNDEKTNGVQVKILAESGTSGAGTDITTGITNKQTIIEVM